MGVPQQIVEGDPPDWLKEFGFHLDQRMRAAGLNYTIQAGSLLVSHGLKDRDEAERALGIEIEVYRKDEDIQTVHLIFMQDGSFLLLEPRKFVKEYDANDTRENFVAKICELIGISFPQPIS